VTGGAQGLGASYALRLAEEGATVVIADIKDGGQVKEAVTEKGGEALALHTDVTSEEGDYRIHPQPGPGGGRRGDLCQNHCSRLYGDRHPEGKPAGFGRSQEDDRYKSLHQTAGDTGGFGRNPGFSGFG
jgi:hypothetical protein